MAQFQYFVLLHEFNTRLDTENVTLEALELPSK